MHPPRSPRPGLRAPPTHSEQPARRPETRSGAAPRRPPGEASPTFSEQEGEAKSISCCAAELSRDVIAFKFPRVSADGAKVQALPGRAERSSGRGQGGQGSRLLERVPAPGARTARRRDAAELRGGSPFSSQNEPSRATAVGWPVRPACFPG